MTVLLSSQRGYAGYAAGTIAAFHPTTESALIAQGLATNSAAVPTTGAVTTSEFSGRCAIAAGSSSVVITNPNVAATMKVAAVINQAVADTTLLRVERVVPAAGSFTIFGTANATATTVIDWWIVLDSGETPNQ
jgi:hypothetical protein